MNLVLLPVEQILLDKDNPRIKQYLEIYTEINAEMLALALSDSSSGDASTTYRSLKESIKISRGIIHPIIVNHDKNGNYTVIEGNTRLQIYKEFLKNEPDGPWNKILSLVYENLTEVQKHEIRLQSHLVGPREWDPYSKAKYLYQLSEIEHLPMEQIVDLCGGGKAEIVKAIDAYKEMEVFYRPYTINNGYDFNAREFSKFREFQNGTIRQSLMYKGFTPENFAQWVADGNIDSAQKVRIIPKVFSDEEATNVFKRKNLTEAERVLNANDLANEDLSKHPYETLAKSLYSILQQFPIDEIMNLAKNIAYADKKYTLENLQRQLNFIMDIIKEKE